MGRHDDLHAGRTSSAVWEVASDTVNLLSGSATTVHRTTAGAPHIGRNIADALAAGRVDPTPLISAQYALKDAEAAFARASAPGVLKVLVQP